MILIVQLIVLLFMFLRTQNVKLQITCCNIKVCFKPGLKANPKSVEWNRQILVYTPKNTPFLTIDNTVVYQLTSRDADYLHCSLNIKCFFLNMWFENYLLINLTTQTKNVYKNKKSSN